MVWSVIAWTVALAASIPLLYFALEVFIGIRPDANCEFAEIPDASVAVLIPAHDEESGITATVRGVRDLADERTRILVVADNCRDRTAECARMAGADVVDRSDRENRGKGYALEFGRQALQENPPDVVVVLDADCSFAPGSIQRLAMRALHSGEPVQAANLQSAGVGASPLVEISNFAMLIKNVVRARGLYRLSGGTLLFGTGMAFPWRIFAIADFGAAELVEDTTLSLALARSGVKVQFEGHARVTSAAPALSESLSQRRRWEHGFMHTALSQAAPLILHGMRRRSRQCLFLGMHLLVAPLALLFLASALALALLFFFSLKSGVWAPFALLMAALFAACVAVLVSWYRHGQTIVRFRSLALAPGYLVWKIPIYAGFLVARQVAWNRVRRPSDDPAGKSSDSR